MVLREVVEVVLKEEGEHVVAEVVGEEEDITPAKATLHPGSKIT